MTPWLDQQENIYELTAHAISHLMQIEDGVAVRAHQLRPVYVLEVYFHLRTERTVVERVVADWATHCEATMDSDITCVLVSDNIGMLKDLTDRPDVEFTDLIREPGQDINIWEIPTDWQDD